MKFNLFKVNSAKQVLIAFMLSIILVACGGGGGGGSSSGSTSPSNTQNTNTKGNLVYTLVQPGDITLNTDVVAVDLKDINGTVVSTESVTFGQESGFNNLAADNYALTTSSGFADAKTGVYYEALNQSATVTANNTTNLGNISLTKLTSNIVPVTLSISGLESGDTVSVAVTDNGKYTFNQFTAQSGNTSLKFINGDNVTLNFTVGAKYQTVSPMSVTISNNQVINVAFTKINVNPQTEGKITYTLVKPGSITLSNNSMKVNLKDTNNNVVSSESATFNQSESFNNVLAGNYTLTTDSGLADAKTGIYYNALSQAATVTGGNTTGLGNISLTNLTSGIVPVTLNITGLDNGDTANIVITDNGKYQFNTFTASAGNTPLKFVNGDTVTFNFTVNSKYQSESPVSITVTSGKVVNVVFTKVVVPNASVIFGPYKDVGTSMNWYSESGYTYVMSTAINQPSLTSIVPLVQVLPSTVKTATWAFATGECGSENWAGISSSDFAAPNINSFKNANKNYILSTGGAAGAFTCSSNAGMKKFIDTYMSPNLVGVDMDIEGGRITNSQISSLISTLVYAKQQYPNLRISFTLATLAASDGSYAGLNSEGDYVVRAAQNAGLDFYVNLMTMDYGNSASSSICVMNATTKQCDMGRSAIQAVTNLQHTYGIANNRIEVTPLIGEADVPNEVFTINDNKTVAAYVKDNGLAGYHYWSFDRDTPCTASNNSVTTTCNGATGVTTLQYTNTAAPYFQ